MDTFDVGEHRSRIARAQKLMRERGIQALFFTSEANVRYFTGYTSHRWQQPTSPQFGVLPRDGDPILVLPTIEIDRASDHPWLKTIREASLTKGAIDVLVDVFEDIGATNGTIAAELGTILRICMPYNDFQNLQGRLEGSRFVDGSDIFWDLRMIKSSAEVDEIRKSLAITARALGDLHKAASPGATEHELHAVMSSAVMLHGADRPGSMPLASRSFGEFHRADSHLRSQTRRAVRDGDLVWLDAGSVVGGYWSDTFRMFSVGKARQEYKDAYATIYECVDATIAATRPGVPSSDAMNAFRNVISKSSYTTFAESKLKTAALAHGIGLDLIEPPYMNATDQSLLLPGMVLTVEPFLYEPDIGFFMIEEQVLVTETGCEVLSERSPPQIPEV